MRRAEPDWRVAALLGLAAALLRIPLLARLPGGWDAVDFALALERYDLAAMQPHFPGYPVFVWLGRLAHLWIADPFVALSAVSGVAGALGVAAFYLIAGRLLPAVALPERRTGGPGAPRAWREEVARVNRLSDLWEADQARVAAPAAGAWFALSPLVWLTGTQPMSDSLGLMALLGALYCALRWFDAPRPAYGWAAGAGLALGLSLGVRLSYFPFALTLAALALVRLWRGRGRVRELCGAMAAAAGLAAGVAPWLAWQFGLEGAGRWWELAIRFTTGHLTDWGNAVGGPLSPGGRAVHFFLYNWLGAGLGGPVPDGGLWRLIPALVTVTGLAAWVWPRGRAHLVPADGADPASEGEDAGRRTGASRRAWQFLACWIVPYLLWAYLGQNPLNPRHVLPLVPPAVLLAAGGWLRWARVTLAFLAEPAPAGLALAGAADGLSVRRPWPPPPINGGVEPEPAGPGPAARRTIVMTTAALLVTALWVTAFPLVLTQLLHPPPAVAMAHYVADSFPARLTRLYTWEEERILRYYAPAYTVVRLRRPDDFLRDLLAAPEPPERILATSYVLEGFGAAGAEIRRYFTPVATFSGDPQVYPTYGRITLYEAGPDLYEYARRR